MNFPIIKECTFKPFILVAVTCCFIQSCSDKPKISTEDLGPADNYGCPIVYNGDTINRSYKGVKQGHFVLFDTDVQRNTAHTKSPPEAVYTEVNKQNSMTSPGKPLEEGDYKDDKKQGIWTYYNPDGSIKTTVKFKDNVPVNN